MNTETNTPPVNTATAVPATISPTGQDIPTVTHAAPEAKPVVQKIDAAAEIGLPKPKQMGPKEALGKLSEGEGASERIAKHLRDRQEKGGFRPVAPAGGKPKTEKKTTPKPAKLETPPPEEPEAIKDAPTKTTEAPKEKPKLDLAEKPKVKIGDKEMTADEVAAYVAELEAKTKQPEQQTDTEKTTSSQDDTAKREREFIDATAQDFTPADYGIDLTPDTLDTILSGGQEGVDYFLKTIARVAAAAELRARQWASEQFNPILDDINKQLSPVSEQYGRVTQYERERTFFERHADLTQYRGAVRNVANALRSRYPKETAAMSSEEFDEEVAKHVRAMAGEFGGSMKQEPERTAATALTPEPKPRPTPPAGHPPSGNGAAKVASQQASFITAASRFR